MLLLSSAQFMLVFDAAVLFLALPKIQATFGLSPTNLQWVVTAYALTFGGFMLIGGRAADLYGRRRVFTAGVLSFSLSSLAAGASVTGAMLVAARAIQGLSGAFMAPAALALLTTTFPPGANRNRALAINGIMVSTGFVAGFILGGILTTVVSWRAGLLINVPIGIVVALVARTIIVDDRNDRFACRIDVAGAALVTSGVVALIYAIAAWGGGGGTLRVVSSLSVGAALLGAFVVSDGRAIAPLVPRRLLADRAVSAGSATAALATGSAAGTLLLLTLYLQQVLGYAPIAAALVLTALGGGALLGGALASGLVSRWGPTKTLTRGLMVQGGGTLALAGISRHGNLTLLLTASTLDDFGFVIASVSATIVVTSAVTNADQGIVGGGLNAAIELGSGLGVALAVAVATLTVSGSPPTYPGVGPHAAELLAGVRRAMLVCASVVGLATVVSLLVPSSARARGFTDRLR